MYHDESTPNPKNPTQLYFFSFIRGYNSANCYLSTVSVALIKRFQIQMISHCAQVLELIFCQMGHSEMGQNSKSFVNFRHDLLAT